MKVYNLKIDNKSKLAIELDNKLYYLDSLGYKINDILNLIENRIDLRAIDFNNAEEIRETYKILSPILTPHQDIICVGMNYLEHIDEVVNTPNGIHGGNDDIIYFSKRANEILSTNDEIPLNSSITKKLDYEIELAVIIGKDARNISVNNVKDYIFGFSIFNDISARDLQEKHKQWYCGKSFDGSSIMGPCILINDGNIDYNNLSLKTKINGEIRQENNTKNMIFSVDEIISDLSNKMTLRRGTIIITGTPSGVGLGFKPPKFLKSGDRIEMEIEKIGKLVNVIGV